MVKSLERVLEEIQKNGKADILELGTKRSIPTRSTCKKHLISNFNSYIMSDFQSGLDVDVVADAHRLSKTWPNHTFDLVWGFSIFEHLEKPWIVSEEIRKILKPNGFFFFQTHFIFPEHAYPNDYFRYTESGLRSIFDWASEIKTDYSCPCTIISDQFGISSVTGSLNREGFLNINISGKKV